MHRRLRHAPCFARCRRRQPSPLCSLIARQIYSCPCSFQAHPCIVITLAFPKPIICCSAVTGAHVAVSRRSCPRTDPSGREAAQSCLGTRRGVPGRGLLGTPVAELASTLSMIMDPRLEVEAGRPSTGCKGGGERARTMKMAVAAAAAAAAANKLNCSRLAAHRSA